MAKLIPYLLSYSTKKVKLNKLMRTTLTKLWSGWSGLVGPDIKLIDILVKSFNAGAPTVRF